MISALWEKLDPGFLAPVWLLVGLLAVVAVVLLELGTRRRRREILRDFGSSQLIAALTANISSAKRLLKSVLLVAAVALVCIALARPHLLFDWQEERRSGVDVLIAVDCSKSMLTPDVKPNRIERAKLAISDFGARLPDNRLGLIAFAGDAFLQCPLTLDHEAFQDAVQELDTDIISRPGTDIATAIDLAVDSERSQPANYKFLILVTDGEDLEGRVLTAAKNAAQAGLKIYTVGVGTPSGDRIPETDEMGALQYHRDANGQEVVSRLDENTLRQIAQVTGGAYVPLGQQGEGLDEIYNRYITPIPKESLAERREKIPIERFEWPLGLAVIFLVWEFLLSDRTRNPAPETVTSAPRPALRRRARPPAAATTAALTLGLLAFGTTDPVRAANSTTTAEQDYKSGKYQDAAENYHQAAETQPNRQDLQYNYGDAAYKAGNYSEAEDAFRKSLETPDLKLQEKAYYNLGNAQFQDGAGLQSVDTKKTIDLWEKALHSYDSALKLHDAPDTEHNYEVVKEKLEQLKKQQQQQQQQDQKNSQQNPQNQQGQNQQQSQSQGSQQQQNQPGQNQQNGGQDQQQQNGGDQQQQNQNGQGNQDNNKNNNAPVRTYSGTREQDKQDPEIRSREDAENLLDSLKDDEHHITERSLQNQNNQPPPPASGKDW